MLQSWKRENNLMICIFLWFRSFGKKTTRRTCLNRDRLVSTFSRSSQTKQDLDLTQFGKDELIDGEVVGGSETSQDSRIRRGGLDRALCKKGVSDMNTVSSEGSSKKLSEDSPKTSRKCSFEPDPFGKSSDSLQTNPYHHQNDSHHQLESFSVQCDLCLTS